MCVRILLFSHAVMSFRRERSVYVPLTCWNGAERGNSCSGAQGLPQLTPFPRFLVLISGVRLAKRTYNAAHIPAPKISIRRNEMAGGSKQEVMAQSLGVLCVKWLYEAFFTLLHAGSHHTSTLYLISTPRLRPVDVSWEPRAAKSALLPCQ